MPVSVSVYVCVHVHLPSSEIAVLQPNSLQRKLIPLISRDNELRVVTSNAFFCFTKHNHNSGKEKLWKVRTVDKEAMYNATNSKVQLRVVVSICVIFLYLYGEFHWVKTLVCAMVGQTSKKT